jgi:hypothetical protein
MLKKDLASWESFVGILNQSPVTLMASIANTHLMAL